MKRGSSQFRSVVASLELLIIWEHLSALAVYYYSPTTSLIFTLIMSEIEPQSSVEPAGLEQPIPESVDTSSQAEPGAPHGEHEVESVPTEPPADETSPETDAPVDEHEDSKANGTEPQPSTAASTAVVEAEENALSPPADDSSAKQSTDTTDAEKTKPAMSVKTTGSKSAGPSTPLVKKVSAAKQFLSSS